MEHKNLNTFLSRYKVKKGSIRSSSRSKSGRSSFAYASYQQKLRFVVKPSIDACIEKVKDHEGIVLHDISASADMGRDYFGCIGTFPYAGFQISFSAEPAGENLVIKYTFFHAPIENSHSSHKLNCITAEFLENMICEAFEIAEGAVKNYLMDKRTFVDYPKL